MINGRKLKSINQFYNKRKAKLQSQLLQTQKSSKRIEALAQKRYQRIENFLHHTSKIVVEILETNRVGTLVIGKNDGWKQSVNLGKKTNQSFTQIPHSKLIEKITYKARLAGIKVVEVNESYTSKTSALDLEQPTLQKNYQGKRIKRGLFRSSKGIKWNADINASIQIMRKYSLDVLTREEIERLAVNPILVNPV